MALVPNGRPRLMVSQRIDNPLIAPDTENIPVPDNVGQVPPENLSQTPGDTSTGLLQEQPDNNQIEKQHKGSGITESIMAILEKMGYERRRLYDFAGKMVHEKITPGGDREVEVVIPSKRFVDKYTTEDIDDAQLKQVIKQITDANKLYFNGAEKADKKIVMKFNSINPTEQVDPNAMYDDGLDEVYGKPAGSSKEKSIGSKKSAFTIQEMIKDNKDPLIKKLMSILGLGV